MLDVSFDPMAITFKFGGVTYTADTPQEASEMLGLLRKQRDDAKKQKYDAWFERVKTRGLQYRREAEALINSYDENKFRWNSDYFLALMDRLGAQQKQALALLVTRQNLADEELRNVLKVSGNQALAGILSGISKQAKALYIPPRAIFDFENTRVGGKRRSDYLVVDEFRQIASKMNWPPPDLVTG